ncbi:MAG: nicotinamide-nucleotide adenylyltransferase [Candidatus Altiarchaeales archaeon]|nr:MAG: nicotinamide-nucleotide adenylyltransferase [Candidatus Altiarchaeales archaeon]RLI94542.1 MAG: nicotinamide-nucleotide adenylyltransferase [Candidatus Altiarchaeales archaeon]RLI95325.1 MAG: nicotinamide-nucleotide adenylyltransferase [Candidatus Altiarchaeales archaeon]HDO82220.1 nicotinamide-nucleotide adenylyltransferase [Candidatus Altiarchaeales archaeon]HEX54869.1 nicotinamide-nucleotide adenylyltransferase [Candidatus Altiarchaeales archaeon]
MVTALIIGRFQPFHFGHLKLIEWAADHVDSIIIGIGSSQESHTWENPFTARERRRMIEKSLRTIRNYKIYEIPDVDNDQIWVAHVKRIVPKFDVVYTNGELEKRLFREAGFEVRSTPFFKRNLYSGTEIRRRIASGERWESLVPQGTVDVIKDVNGERRIRELARFI